MGAGWKEIKVFEHSQGTPVIKRLKDLSDSLFTMLNEKQKQRMMFTHRIIKCISLAKVYSLNSCDEELFFDKVVSLQALSRVFQIKEAISVKNLFQQLSIEKNCRGHNFVNITDDEMLWMSISA